MPLALHLSLHLIIALAVGYTFGRYFKNVTLGLIAGFVGGFFIDLDHILEYFLTLPWPFHLTYFLQGREILISDKIRLWFHAWEYLPVLLLAAWLLRRRRKLTVFLLTVAVAAGVHLLSDSLINAYPLKFYSLSYRASVNFSAARLLPPEKYQENLKDKAELGL